MIIGEDQDINVRKNLALSPFPAHNSSTDDRTTFFRSDYDYGFTVSHDSDSLAHALGVRVIWMLTPFVKFKKVTSFQLMGKYRVEQKDDSVTFKASACNN